MIPEKPKNKIFIVPQAVKVYQKEDRKLQEDQNNLILRNTWVTIVLGILTILAQLLEVFMSVFFR